MSGSNDHARKILSPTLRKLKTERMKNTQLENELCIVNAENKSMKILLNTGTRSMGRNKMSKLNYDGFMKANKPALVDFVKHKVFPHHEFLHNSWSFLLQTMREAYVSKSLS